MMTDIHWAERSAVYGHRAIQPILTVCPCSYTLV